MTKRAIILYVIILYVITVYFITIFFVLILSIFWWIFVFIFEFYFITSSNNINKYFYVVMFLLDICWKKQVVEIPGEPLFERNIESHTELEEPLPPTPPLN